MGSSRRLRNCGKILDVLYQCIEIHHWQNKRNTLTGFVCYLQRTQFAQINHHLTSLFSCNRPADHPEPLLALDSRTVQNLRFDLTRFLKAYHRRINTRIAGSPLAKAEFRIQEKRQKTQRRGASGGESERRRGNVPLGVLGALVAIFLSFLKSATKAPRTPRKTSGKGLTSKMFSLRLSVKAFIAEEKKFVAVKIL